MPLRELEIVNFRSIKERLALLSTPISSWCTAKTAPVKPVYCSAIELALTGRVLSLERSDPANQRSSRPHWSAQSGRVRSLNKRQASLKTDLKRRWCEG